MNRRGVRMQRNGTDIDYAIERLVRRSCLLLDEERFDDYLDLCTSDFRYAIKTYSTEIRRDMTWLSTTREQLADLFAGLSEHVRSSDVLHRQAAIEDLEIVGGEASARAAVTVHRTDVHGRTRLFAVGRYHDRVRIDGNRPLLRERTVHLQTRLFDNEAGGSHLPL